MNTLVTNPPTEQEIESALEIISRAAKASQASGETDAELLAFRQQREKNRALVAECDQLQDVIYRLLKDALPQDLQDLLGYYGLMVVAPYAVNQKNFNNFQSSVRKIKKLLGLHRN